MSKVLTEYIDLNYDQSLIKESIAKGQPIVIKKALLQRCDSLNANKRIYPRRVLEKEFCNYQKMVKDNRACRCFRSRR